MRFDPRWVPVVMIVLSVCAAVGYAIKGDWRRVVYWLASAVLITAVTF